MNRGRRRSVAAPSGAPGDVNVVVTGAGPHTIVLLHGFSDNVQTWRRVVPALAVAHPDRVDSFVLIGMPGVTAVPLAWRAAASRPASVAMRTALRPVPFDQLQRGFGWIYARA